MTQNLRLVGPLTLNSTYSDMTSGSFSLPASAGGQWASNIYDSTGANTAHVYDTGNINYGAYYNWYTAVAGSMNYSSASGNAPSSICPKNWRLSSSSDLQTLYSAYSSVPSFISAASIQMSGYYDMVGHVGDQGTYFYATSSTPYTGDSIRATYLAVGASQIWFPEGYGKAGGYSIRCVAR